MTAQIPDQNRKIITYHHAFAYFAKRYGFETEAYLVLNLIGTECRRYDAVNQVVGFPSSEVMFTEPQVNIGKRYTEAAVDEVGGKLFTLYTGSLTASVPTYIEMMRHNGKVLLEALQ